MSISNTNNYKTKKATSISDVTTKDDYYTNYYTRPTGWLSLPDITGQQKMVGLLAITAGDSNFVSFTITTSTGNVLINWGDGNTSSVASNTQVYYNYDYSLFDTSNTTVYTDNYGLTYKQVIITVTPVTGNITGINLHKKHNKVGLQSIITTNWLDLAINGQYINTLVIGYFSTVIRYTMLENVWIGDNVITSHSNQFSQNPRLQSVYIKYTTTCTNMNTMFSGCSMLKALPVMNTDNVTDMSNFISGCRELEYMPLYNTANCTNFGSFFSNVKGLKQIPTLNTSKATTMAGMFQNTILPNGIAPMMNTSTVTSMSNMFYGSNIAECPLYNTSNVTSMSSMFYGTPVQSIPLFDTSKVTDMSSMFYGTSRLTTIPQLNTSNVTNMANMFRSSSIEYLPTFDMTKVTNIDGIYYATNYLRVIPPINATRIQTAVDAFTYSRATVIPSFNNLIPSGGAIVNSAYCVKIAAINLASTLGSIQVTQCGDLSECYIYGFTRSISFTQNKLGKSMLELLCTNAGTVSAASQTLGLSINPGYDNGVFSTTRVTTAGSKTIAMTSTTGMVVGMLVTGIGTSLTTPIANIFTDAGDLVTITSHGLSNGDLVSFATIVTTTGISTNTIYYVINRTADTFQLASTLNGSALPLTTNGTGTMRYVSKIESFVTNTSVTLTRPCTSSGTNTLSFRLLDTSSALLKGWTVI
jgi:surface protein